ncbi:uncharacterized protein YrrD [Evansella vedderi]|uniref:Uncharacterized protein YrrD n=1 Tax=Evansella vedderi TaxID=38282 RepID=A0ABT9ZUB0_9BACI|nr:PRC-barrel domain-containing protein [Evansella vedderi]MDQ0254276.1 uncharacterized protein YrrD [Evansella vedderi]
MRTFQKVKGAPILERETKRIIGTVSDLVLSDEVTKVKGYWVQTRKWWSKKHYLSLEEITHEDGDGLYVDKGTTLTLMPKKKNKRLIDGNGHLIGKPILEQDGTMVGIIEDVYFLPDSGMIVGYELTEGLFSDFTKGIRLLKPKLPLIQREESFMVLKES